MKKEVSKQLLPLSIEQIFVILGLIFGLMFVFINPPFQTNDEDRHFVHAYMISDGIIVPKQGPSKIGGEVPNNLMMIVQGFQGIRFASKDKIDPAKYEELKNVKLNPDDKTFQHNFSYTQNPIPFIPHSIGIFIGRMIDSNPIWLGWFGRLGGLLCYLVIIYFTIKITPIFKSVFMLYALTPMVLYQSSSVTYDMMINGMSFLLVALFLYYTFVKEKLERNDYILLLGMIMLHSFSKTGYPLIPFLIFLIPARKFGTAGKPALIMSGIAVFIVIAYLLPDWLWGKVVAGLHVGKDAPILKKDLYHNAYDNRVYNLAHPVEFISNIFKNILFFRQEWTGGTIGRFGYSYLLMPNFFFLLHGIVLMTVAFLDSRKDIVINALQRSLIFVVGFGTVMLIIAGMFMNSPVGAKMVFGLQGRYFLPAIPVLLLLLYNSKWELPEWNKWKYLTVAVYAALTLAYTMTFLNDFFWG